ncbi:MAG TPA: MurR/RpiR family transcriptional regulator [Clostridiaceae bacterium]|nr:MurR/RpiR family transcriptional regulator [Clostridiaceae bacterium]
MELSRLVKNYDELTGLEKMVVENIMAEPDQVIRLTVNELAEKMFVSKTTIINLSKKLGFEGFTDLRYYIKEYLINKTGKKQNVTYDGILANLYSEITKTLSLQNEENISKIAELLQNAKTVYVIARGASKPIADLLSSRLSILKIKSIFINDYNLIEIISERIVPGEVLILISLSGETEKIKNAAKIARAKNVDVVGITSFSNNALQEIANYKMFCFSNKAETKNNDLVSRVGIHIIAQLLIEYINSQERK